MRESARAGVPTLAARWTMATGWAFAAATLIAVFVVGWVVPGPINEVVSDSQAVGFSNRASILVLLLGCAALAVGAFLTRMGVPTSAAPPTAAVSNHVVSRAERVNHWLVVAGTLAVLCMVGSMALVFRDRPTADAGYFIDRLHYLINGSVPFSEFEFAYGPLLLFAPFAAFRLVQPFGGSVYLGYYLTVAASHLAGLAMAVYLLNRLRMPHHWRNLFFAGIVVIDLMQVTLGLNYEPARFLAPFVLLVWSLSFVLRSSHVAAGALSIVSVVGAFCLSPEMGIATCVGAVGGLVMLGFMRSRMNWLLALVAALCGVAGLAVFSAIPLGAFSAFSTGANYFPFLPGLPALVYVSTMLLLSWGVGVTTRLDDDGGAMLQFAWFAASLVLVIAAMGRADFGHLFWNGLGAILLTAAVLAQVWPRGLSAFAALVAAAYVASCITFTVSASAPMLFATGVNSEAISRTNAKHLAPLVRRSTFTGGKWYDAALISQPDDDVMRRLADKGGVMVLSMLQGSMGSILAERHALVPSNGAPVMIFSRVQLNYTLAQIDTARFLVMGVHDYNAAMAAAGGREMAVPQNGMDPYLTGILLGFPIAVRPRFPTLSTSAVLGSAFKQSWVLDERAGDYVVLRRR